MKALNPTSREKKRYLLLEGRNLTENVDNSILEFVGILGYSKIGLEWIEKKENNSILSINRETLDMVKACFCVWPEKISVKMVSGTLKSLKNKMN